MRTSKALPCALLAALLAAPAFAAEPKTYFTFGAAASGYDVEVPPGCTLVDSNDSSMGGSLGVGYAFDTHLAVEFGFISLGTLDAIANCPGPITVTLTAPDSGLQVSGILNVPLFDANETRGATLYGRLGAFSWSENAQSGVEPIVGAGLEWRFNAHTTMRVEYDSFGDGLDAVQLLLRWDY
jgi:opacity protein-like surface antigen